MVRQISDNFWGWASKILEKYFVLVCNNLMHVNMKTIQKDNKLCTDAAWERLNIDNYKAGLGGGNLLEIDFT